MKIFWPLAILTLSLLGPQMAQAGNKVSQQECKAWFNKIDRDRDGFLSSNEGSDVYLSRITLASENDSDSDFIMQKAFFIKECTIGSLGRPNT